MKYVTDIEALVSLALVLPKLNKGKGKNSKQFPVLKTKLTDPEIWWNKLTWDQKEEVGGIAIHFNKMSANYKWGFSKYADLVKSQRKIIDFVLSKKDENYSMFDIKSLLKL